MQPKKYIEWSQVREWLENNWTFNNPLNYSPDELDEMAIGIAGEIDKFVQDKLKRLLNDLMARSKKTLISFEELPEDTTGRIITDADLEAIKKAHLG